MKPLQGQQRNPQYWIRRMIHLGISLVPVVYYNFKEFLSDFFTLSPYYWLSILGFIALILEVIRLQQGWLFYGQREYERKLPSAMVWTILGLIIVLLFAPKYHGHEAAFGLPIIWSLAIGDPLLGECRMAGFSIAKTILIALIPLSLIWLLASFWFGIPYWLVFILPGLAITAEWPRIDWVDDNFMMLIIPLIFIELFY